MAYMKKHCPGCCSGCNNGYARADCTNNTSSTAARRGCGCSSCGHNHDCGCNSSGCGTCGSGCSSCSSGCSYCGRSSNGFGALRSVTGPFSNCANWWSNDDPCFPYYTGPCGPCDSCGNCCCREWPWPWPPMPPVMPVNYGYDYSRQTDCNTGRNDDCGHNHCTSDTGYTSHKNCYRTEASSNDAYAARQVKPIVDCGSCTHRCNCDD